MQSDIHIRNTAETCSIDIEGTIGIPEEWQFEEPATRVATYEKFRDTLQRIEQIETPEVVVNIRSTGGDVNDALLIYEALCSLNAHITTRCYGYTASAATLIAQAASEGCREISANALYLIHNSICTSEGNAEQTARSLELLRKTDTRLSEVYANRAGRPVGDFATLMSENDGNGRWLTPAEAVEAGLADRITDTAGTAKSASLTQNIVRKCEELLTLVGIRSSPAISLPEDRNILHFDENLALQRQSVIAIQDAQQAVKPTVTKAREDPSVSENIRSANENAYAEDARRLKHN